MLTNCTDVDKSPSDTPVDNKGGMVDVVQGAVPEPSVVEPQQDDEKSSVEDDESEQGGSNH